jgi:acyl-CoA thioester hydrolase
MYAARLFHQMAKRQKKFYYTQDKKSNFSIIIFFSRCRDSRLDQALWAITINSPTVSKEIAMMEKSADQFELEMDVRDYELDLEGIVNNSVYLNYLEHARHLFMQRLGLDFSELHKQGVDAVVTRIEIDYLSPLRSGDRFVVRVRLERKGRLRLMFHQSIVTERDARPVVRALVTATCLVNGRPQIPPAVEQAVNSITDWRAVD